MSEKSRFNSGCQRLIKLIRAALNQYYRDEFQTPEWTTIEVEDIHDKMRVDYDQVPICLNALKHVGIINDYRMPKRKKIVMSPADWPYVQVALPEDFLERSRDFASQTKLDFQHIIFKSTTGEVIEQISQKVITKLSPTSKAYPVAEYLFVVKNEERGSWVPWDEIGGHITGEDDFGDTKLKRRIYDNVLSLNEKAKEIIGAEIIDTHGETEYRIPT